MPSKRRNCRPCETGIETWALNKFCNPFEWKCAVTRIEDCDNRRREPPFRLYLPTLVITLETMSQCGGPASYSTTFLRNMVPYLNYRVEDRFTGVDRYLTTQTKDSKVCLLFWCKASSFKIPYPSCCNFMFPSLSRSQWPLFGSIVFVACMVGLVRSIAIL